MMVLMDHFKRFAQDYTTKDKSAKTVDDKLCKDFILRFGFQSLLHHDQGTELRMHYTDVWKIYVE